jgi:hypothetical protein
MRERPDSGRLLPNVNIITGFMNRATDLMSGNLLVPAPLSCPFAILPKHWNIATYKQLHDQITRLAINSRSSCLGWGDFAVEEYFCYVVWKIILWGEGCISQSLGKKIVKIHRATSGVLFRAETKSGKLMVPPMICQRMPIQLLRGYIYRSTSGIKIGLAGGRYRFNYFRIRRFINS